jgi:hypothetical protein
MVDVKSGRWCAPRSSGAEVPAAIHLEQFVPLLVRRFGDDWFRRGGVSVRVRSTTVPGEPVRCRLEDLPGGRCRVWVNAEGEALILQGTAALGEDPASELQETLANVPAGGVRKRTRPGDQPRVLRGVLPGRTSRPLPVRLRAADVDARLAVVTEPMACYRDPSRFGGRVAPLGTVCGAMRVVEAELVPLGGAVERLEAGVEFCHLDGPVLCERDYRVQGRVLAVRGGARDETLWYQADLRQADDDEPVARLTRMERFAAPGLPLSHSAPR